MGKSSILNKKGFTLLELLIAVSIFGIISVMTFSIINYVPKLAKSESGQYSERAYVRRALTEITNTIQSASIVSFPSIKFTMPDGEIVNYEYNQGNVYKVVDGIPQRLMESVSEFTLTSDNYHLFDIHIKTAKEGKTYDFKVERRAGSSTVTDAVISTITPTSAIFDKNTPENISVNINLNGNILNRLRNGGYILNPTTDYAISGNVLTLKKEYLANQLNGTLSIIFDVTNGVDPVFSVEIIDTSTNLKIAGNSFEDDLARMNYPGNVEIDPYDNTWIITITNGTVDGNIDKDKLTITGLPAGITVTAVKGTGNTIVISLSGSTSAPVDTTRSVKVVIEGSGVTEPAALDSDPIEVLLLPGATYASPERNLLFTNEVAFKNDVTITGDIVIGRGNSLTELGNNTRIYGYVYADSSIYVKNDAEFGKPGKETKIFVNGSADFRNNADIYGDLFYRNTLNTKNKFYISGKAEQSAVDIPLLSLPELKEEQWYINNGYTIVENQLQNVDFQSNGKYYFKTGYEIRNLNRRLDNVRIVGKGNIDFSSHFTGSGVIFVPLGEVHFKNGCTFKGICVTIKADLETSSILSYQRYAELPFD